MSIVGIGIDQIELARIRDCLERFGDRFLARCFTADELAYCLAMRDPAPSLSARYAAKEAGAKALGTGIAHGVGWTEIEVRRERGQAPTLHLHGRARAHAERLGVARAHLSLTHSRDLAAAYVILEK